MHYLMMLAFWVGGYFFFVYGGHWAEAKVAVGQYDPIVSRVGPVIEITPSPLGFFYRFGADTAETSIQARVRGTLATQSFAIKLKRSMHEWIVLSAEEK